MSNGLCYLLSVILEPVSVMKFSDVKKTCTTVKYSLMLMREMDDRCFAEPHYLVLMEQEGSIFVPERLREIACLPTLKALLNSYCS